MKRRTFLGSAVLPFLSGCLGSGGTDEPQNDEFEPADLLVGSSAETNKTVSVEITQDNETVYSDELDINTTNISSRSIAVEDVIQKEGEYVVHAELNGMNKTEKLSVSDSDRAISVLFDDEAIDIGVNVNGG